MAAPYDADGFDFSLIEHVVGEEVLAVPSPRTIPKLRADKNGIAYGVAWLVVVDRKTKEEVAEESGLTVAEVVKILTSPKFQRHAMELTEAVGTLREAAIKRYSFDLEQLVGKAIARISGILDDPEERGETVLRAAVAVLDRTGVSAARKVEGTIKFELPEGTLRRIEEAVKDLPLLENDDGTWAYATEKPVMRVVDEQVSEPESL